MISAIHSAAYQAPAGFQTAAVAPVRKRLFAVDSSPSSLQLVVVVVVVLVALVGSLWSPVAR